MFLINNPKRSTLKCESHWLVQHLVTVSRLLETTPFPLVFGSSLNFLGNLTKETEKSLLKRSLYHGISSARSQSSLTSERRTFTKFSKAQIVQCFIHYLSVTATFYHPKINNKGPVQSSFVSALNIQDLICIWICIGIYSYQRSVRNNRNTKSPW